MLTAYRLIKSEYTDSPLSPEGAKKFGGRWNSKGTPLVYMGTSASLVTLEVLVHLHHEEAMATYFLCTAELPENLVQGLPQSDLPPDWKDDPSPASTAAIGDQWVERGEALALLVPSSIIPIENNILINPSHPAFPDFAKSIRITPFEIDERLLTPSDK